ncbi:MAG: putative ATP-binding cassette transporter [Cyclobacteriaceae bacterium]|jgi:putative ATP-binding cassette transporter
MLKNAGKTIVLISHDEHYYHIADRVATLSEGKIETIKKKV